MTKYNMLNIVIGIIILSIAFFMILDGIYHLSIIQGTAAQSYIMLLGSQVVLNYQEIDVDEIVFGVGLGSISLYFLARYNLL